jgi:hypothetical protein
MDNDDKNDNVFQLGQVVQGGKVDIPEATEEPSEVFPVNDYIVTTMTGQEFYATGFLVFTSHHVAIMKPTKETAIPALVIPIQNVLAAELYEDDDAEEPAE